MTSTTHCYLLPEPSTSSVSGVHLEFPGGVLKLCFDYDKDGVVFNSGLLYYGARYYDPTMGRFISADTEIPDIDNPQSLNRYSYVLNNPLNLVDPTGHAGRDPNQQQEGLGAFFTDLFNTLLGEQPAEGQPQSPHAQPTSGRATSSSDERPEQAQELPPPPPMASPPAQSQGVNNDRRYIYGSGYYGVGGYDTTGWTIKNFLANYLTGNRDTVRLSDVGLDKVFENAPSVKNATDSFIEQTLTRIQNEGLEKYSHSDLADIDVTNVGEYDLIGYLPDWPALFALGNGRIERSATCQANTCHFTFSYRDTFIDALDVKDQWEGNQDLWGSTPYKIEHSWTVEKDYRK